METTAIILPFSNPTDISHDWSPRHQSNPFFRGTTPVPPGINQSYKIVHITLDDGNTIERLGDSEKAKQYKKDAAWTLMNAWCDWPVIMAIRASKKKVPLAVTIRLYLVSLWKRDIDGVEKAAIDAAFSRLNLNDNQVVHKIIDKFTDPENPRLEIDISCALSKKG